MNLNTNEWKSFKITDLFNITAGTYYDFDSYQEGKTPYVSASASNNGVCQMIDLPPDFDGNRIVTGKVECNAFYQGMPFSATSDANVFTPKFPMTTNVGLFLTSIITFNEQGKWSYGRQCRIGDSKGIVLKLPIQHNSDGTPIIDTEKKYSKNGYIPDWQFMEEYIKSLHYKPLTTSRAHGPKKDLNVVNWKEFQLSRICHIDFGNKFDNDKMTYETPSVNFISRTADNNGVSDVVDRIEGEHPYPAGCLSVALGGSIGSCFLQEQPFYTGQNVAVLTFPSDVSTRAKLFFSQIFMFEVKGKFVAFGRELNKHLKTDLTLYLPILHHPNSSPVIDPDKKYSKEGYVPDWQFMEDYINSLPYSDKIK